MIKRFVQSKSITWMSRSLFGNIVLVEVAFGIPLIFIAAYKAYSQNELTAGFLLLAVVLCLFAGGVGGLLFWFGISRSALHTRRQLIERDKIRATSNQKVDDEPKESKE